MSATVPPPDAQVRTSSTWRIPIIVLVAVLAVSIGAVAGSFLLSARAGLGGAGAAAGYVPADAPVYFEFRAIPSAEQDAALRDVLGRFPSMGLSADEPIADQLVAMLDEELAGGDIPFTYAEDIAPWFDGRVAFSLNELPPTADPMADPTALVPNFTVMFGVTDVAAATATADRLRAEAASAGTTLTSSDHAGTTIWSAADTPGAYAVADDQLLLATTVADIETALDVNAGRQPGLLSATEKLGPLAERLPDDWLFLVAVNGDALMEAIRADVDANQPEMSPLFDTLLADQSLNAVMAAYATADGIAFDAVTSAPSGELTLENRDRGLAAQIPSDAIFYADGGKLGVGLGRGVEAVKAALTAADPTIAQQLDGVESSLGAPIEDFVTWMDDGAIAAGWDGSELWAGMVITPTDAAAARERVEQLAGFARLAALDPSSGITVSDETIAGVEVTTIGLMAPPIASDSPGIPTAIQFSVTDERVLIGIGDTFVQRVLELEPADSLAQSDRFLGAVGALGGLENAGMSYLDLTALRVAVEGAAGDMLGAMGTYESEVQPWLTPLDAFVAVARVEGNMLVQQTRLIVK